VIKAFLGLFEGGNIRKHGHKMCHHISVIAHGADGHPAGVSFSVFASVADFALPVVSARQLVPHGRKEQFVVPARGQDARRLAQYFTFGVTGNFAEGPVYSRNFLLGIGKDDAFGRTLEYGGCLQKFFLHLVALGNVVDDGQDAVVGADQQRVTGDFTKTHLPFLVPDMAGEVAHKAVFFQDREQVTTLLGVDPQLQFQR